MKRTVLLYMLMVAGLAVNAQGGMKIPDYKVPINRQMFHDNIDKEQVYILQSDGSKDNAFHFESHPEADEQITYALTHQVDELQYFIESNDKIEARIKIGYLTGLASMLGQMRAGWLKKEVNPTHFSQIMELYKRLIEANTKGESLVPSLNHLPYDVVSVALSPRIFEENATYKAAKEKVLLTYVKQYPEKAFLKLSTEGDAPFTDSLIKVLGRRFPEQLYSYAQAYNQLGRRIRGIHDDEFVQTVVKLSEQKSGQIYFPFLDNLVKGKITVAQLDAAKDNRVQYYRYLVQTQMDYAKRAVQGDTAIGFKALTQRLERKAKDEFVNEINALHEQPDAVRFKCLQELTAQELYYLAVLSDGLIYTSSYTNTNGVFPLMMRKADNRGDLLLLSLNFDHYRKFISQAASYNTLKTFFATFANSNDAKDLMTTFVSRLEKNEGLEDGVDVADSYASVFETLPDLAKQMLANVKRNYDANVKAGNKRGMVIYNILYKLFLSADSSKEIDLTKELGIPPVYKVPFKALVNDKGEVVTQMFFYGDDDGKIDFDIFVRMFTNAPNWTVDQRNPLWVVAKTTSGVPVYIYANRPLPNEEDKDYQAQSALGEYFEKNKIQPAITFHRGHSYHAETTIGYMAPTSKIVFMGSCGGFNLIDSILKRIPDAHIISSKQIGKRDINRPFFTLLTEKLRNGKDIDWLPFWKEFRAAANISGLEDYIPPYKNLGALFIKAYKKQTGEYDW
ncbi:MAG: hypothetical protein QM727_14990 [Niabella sp.]